MQIECYSQRMLHPFRGVRCILSSEDMQAITTDGVNWTINVADTGMNAFVDVNDTVPFHTSVIRFAKWSLQHGLQHEPMVTLVDYEGIARRVERLLPHLQACQQNIPFGFNDVYELWLLDQAQQPLALLQSTSSETATQQRESLRWRYTRTPGMDDSELRDLLNAIEAVAGTPYRAQWFRRDDHGAGHGLHGINLDNGLHARILESNAFATLLIREDALAAPAAQQVQRYHHQLAPWLLMLPNLNVDLRAQLEIQASEQAGQMARLYRLYPQVLDTSLLNRVRVEARLRGELPA